MRGPDGSGRPRGRQAFGVALLWLCSLPATAAVERPPLGTDRPGENDPPALLAPGEIQLELGSTYAADDSDGVRTHALSLAGALARVGLLQDLELRFGWSGYLRSHASGEARPSESGGAADAWIGGRVHLLPARGARPEIATEASLSLPTGAGSVSSGRPDPALRVLFWHHLGQRLGLGYNLGARWVSSQAEGRSRRLSTGLYTLVLDVPVGERVGTFFEVYGRIPLSAESPPRHTFDAGLTYRLSPDLQLDASGGLGLSESSRDFFVSLGAAVRFP